MVSHKGLRVDPSGPLHGEIRLPGDKSISHRALILGAIAEGRTYVRGLSTGIDVQRTRVALEAMGVRIEDRKDGILIRGRGAQGLVEPDDVLDAGNSGTTARLMLGVLGGRDPFAVLTGDGSLRSRPMGRVVTPLRKMGAEIRGRGKGDRLPLALCGGSLKAIRYRSPVASAQLKSAILLAGLRAKGRTRVEEPWPSRDHTERMFAHFGIALTREERAVEIDGGQIPRGAEVDVPGDISSAAFFVVAGLIVPGSEILIRDVGVNKTRTGFLDVLLDMGAKIEILNQREVHGEPVADLAVSSSRLEGIEVGGVSIPRCIDEIPVLCVAAALAEGTTAIRDAGELRVKESDRIAAIRSELSRFGVGVEEYDDGLRIEGTARLKATVCASHGDHRIAMAMIVAGLAASGESLLEGTACIATSLPEFLDLLKMLKGPVSS